MTRLNSPDFPLQRSNKLPYTMGGGAVMLTNIFITLSNELDSSTTFDSFLDYGLLHPERRFLNGKLSPLNVALNSLIHSEKNA